MITNSQGKIWYGMHFYPGVAEYAGKDGGKPYRVFLNEDTIRQMDPTFAGRPLYVRHVDDVPKSIDEVRKDADGYVVESFYNEADGKHWCKFITVTSAADEAIKKGFRLSNAYLPRKMSQGGLWNGVSYDKQITEGEYEHLALVTDPRYEESIVMTPEQFKDYNRRKQEELKALKNEKEKGKGMLTFFKQEKIENGADFEKMQVQLPKSQRVVSVLTLVNEADAIAEAAGKPQYAVGLHLVKAGGEELTVDEMAKRFGAMKNELEKLKNGDFPTATSPTPVSAGNGKKKNEDEKKDEEDPKDKKENEEDEDEEEDEEEDDKKKNKAKGKKKNSSGKTQEQLDADRAEAEKLRNAGGSNVPPEVVRVDFATDQVARGKARYGS